MCCRYFVLQEHLAEILGALGIAFDAAGLPSSRYNVTPGRAIPVIRRTGKIGRPEFIALHLGLQPVWAGPERTSRPLVNARAETLAARPAFRDAFRARRCLVPASGFYEWKVRGRTRLPWLFCRPAGRPFCLAGLWEARPAPDVTAMETCAVITTAPNALMAPIHHRMPAILASPAACRRWLDPRSAGGELADLLHSPQDDAFTARRVSARVSNVRNDDPACLAPTREEVAHGSGPLLFSLD